MTIATSYTPTSDAGPSKHRVTHADLHHLSPEIIVIGAGIAGTALSYSLSHSGRKVLLLERDLREPDRIVGELLQPGGVAALQKLGLKNVLDGIDATPVEGYCVVNGDKQVPIPYPALEAMVGGEDVKRLPMENGKIQENGKVSGYGNGYGNGHGETHDRWHVESLSGKKEGRSFHHGRLISSLRQRCLHDAPDLTVLEGTVRDLIYCDHTDRVIGVNVAFRVPKPTSNPSPDVEEETETETIVRKIYAPLTIIADGCFSKFRTTKGSRIPKPVTRSHFVGVIINDTDLPIPNHGTVCLTQSGPVLLYQIAHRGRETRMLVDVKGKLPSLADGSLKNHLIQNYVPHLPQTLRSPVMTALKNQRLRTMPNSFLPPAMQGLSSPSTLSGAILVGDAYNMRHPLTGGGMTVAFNDAVILTAMLQPHGTVGLGQGREGLEDWGKIAEGLREWWWERKNLAGVVNVLSMALYDLFGGADEPNFEVLREGCFRYFELGGECVGGPVGLLSALTPKPLILFYHFFAVAFYSIYILLTNGRPTQTGVQSSTPGILEIPGLLVFSGRVFWTACVVLLPVIWTEFKI